MVTTTVTPLGASTTNRKWRVDVDLNDGVGSPSWVPVAGITNLAPNFDNAHFEDDSDYDSSGFQSQTKTAAAWGATITIARKGQTSDATTYDPGQEHLRTKSIGKFGIANSVTVRIYEMEPNGPRIEAYTGKASVSFQEQGGAETALSTAQITLNGQGALAIISHPDTGSAVPTISGVTLPAGQTTLHTAGGDVIVLAGNHFTGTTGVTFGGTAAGSFVVESDGRISAAAPAKTAGSVSIIVTNAAGSSSAFAVTYA